MMSVLAGYIFLLTSLRSSAENAPCGQGGNQGLEDALVISSAIAEINRHDNWDNLPAIAQAWQKYESLRRPLMTTMQELTTSGIYYYYSASERSKYGQMVYGRNFANMSP